MEYDVVGNLKIDTESFEKALKEAQEKLDKFKKDFQSLNNMSANDSSKELLGSLKDVEKSVQDLKMDFEKVDKSADNVAQSVNDLKKETDNAVKVAKQLETEMGKVSKSSEKAGLTIKDKLVDELLDADVKAKKLAREIREMNDESAIIEATKEWEKQKDVVRNLTIEIEKLAKEEMMEDLISDVDRVSAGFGKQRVAIHEAFVELNKMRASYEAWEYDAPYTRRNELTKGIEVFSKYFKRIDTLKSKIQSAKEEIRELTTLYRNLSVDNNRLGKEWTAKNKEIAKAEAEGNLKLVEKLTKEREAIINDLNAVVSKQSSILDQKNPLKKQIKKWEQSAKKQINNIIKKYYEAVSELEKLSEETGKVSVESKKVEDSISKLDDYIDNATKSVEGLKNETKQVADAGKKTSESVGTVDEQFDQATSSAKKLTAETKKTSSEISVLQKKLNSLKLNNRFGKDFFNLVSKAEGGNGVELKPIYDQLKSKYKEFVKNRAEFEKLFANAVSSTGTRLYPSRYPENQVWFGKGVNKRGFGYIDRKNLKEFEDLSVEIDKVTSKIEKLKASEEGVGGALDGWDSRLYDAHQELDRLRQNAKKVKQEFGEGSEQFKKATADIEKQRKVVQELSSEWNKIHPIEWVSPSTEEMAENLESEAKEINKELKNVVKTSEQMDEPLKKTGAEADKLKNKLKNVFNPLTNRQSLGMIFQKSTDAEASQIEAMMEKNRQKIAQLREELFSLGDASSDLQIKLRKAQGGLEKYGEGNRWSKKWAEDLKTIPPEIEKIEKAYDSVEDEIERLEQENKILGKEFSQVVTEFAKPIQSLMGESERLGKMISTPFKEGTTVATEEMSEFDQKMKAQFDGLNQMLVEAGQMSVEQARIWGTEIIHSLDAVDRKVNEVSKNIRGRMNLFYKNYGGKSGKWFTEQSPYMQSTGRWQQEQLETTRNFMRNISKTLVAESNNIANAMSRMFGGDNKTIQKATEHLMKYDGVIRKTSTSTNQWVHENIDGFNKFARAVQKSIRSAEEELNNFSIMEKRVALQNKYNQQFNQYGAGFLGDANIQKDIQLVNEFHRVTREVSASTNQWVNSEITAFNKFSQAVQKSVVKAREEMELLNRAFRSTGNATGVGFAGTNQFQNLNKSMQEYNRLSNIANLNTQRMGFGFEKFGQYTKQAESNVRSLSGVFRTLRTTMSMIGGMFVWEFAFKIMDATKVTISAKSEMESYYKTLGMGSKEIASFNNSLDKTIGKFQKMNKFQLGETISALGVEFKMSTDEMNQIMKVAPMIVNEYLRAGRSTEEAILAIKDISQGEFLRLSRETGVGAKEIKEAGWSGDNKDILSLYQALEKIGKARHWDVFASKATSLNDVLLITENRMTEFATLLSDAVTPIIVGSFNALGDAFNGASKWYESLDPASKVWTQITVLGTVGLTTAGIFNSHLLPAIKNFGTNIVSSFLGVDSAIVKEKGLAQAIAHETAVERIANIERTNGQRVLNAKIMTLKSEELANKLGMSTTKLRTRYEKLQNQALKISEETYKARGTAERMDILVNKQGMTVEQARTRVTKARTLAQRSLILAEEQGITTSQAMKILMEEEALAEMGTAKALFVRKMGLDVTTISQKGMIVATNERLAQSFPFITALASETVATLGLESATATLVVTLGLLLAPLIAIGLAVAPLIQQFAELQASYEKVNDVLTGGQDRIDSLKESKESLTKTEEKLASKTNLTTQESQKLDSTRQQLKDTTDALKLAEEELAEAQKFDKSRTAYTTQVEANRYRNVKQINEELQKTTGSNDEIISQTVTMDKAYQDMTKNMQIASFMENKRPERFEELNQKLKDSTKNQEEYNQKVKEFGNDWNQAYTDMENAQTKLSDPELSGFDRAMARWDGFWAEAKLKWIEFWADPWGGIEWALDEQFKNWFGVGFEQIGKDWEDFTNWFNDGLEDMSQAWDDFWQPLTDAFNSLSVDSDFDPLAGLKDWWGDTNQWLESIMPDISVESVKDWVKTHIKEPFQKAFKEFMKNPFGGGKDKEDKGQVGGTATKSISLGSLFSFDFNGFKTDFSSKLKGALSGASPILKSAGDLWGRLSNLNGSKIVSSTNQGMAGLKQTVTQKFNQGKAVITSSASAWGKSAYNTGNNIYTGVKNGVGDIASLIRNKFKGIKEAIDSTKRGIASSVKAIADAITSPLSGLHLPSINFGGGYYGVRRSVGGRARIPHFRQPVYGSSPNNMGFETVLRTMLTEQGFRSPSSYQFYPNSQKTTQEAWDSGKANCFDGARVILALASMFGLKGHLVTGTWNGTGHSGAMIGGKLYDMTQFQRRGVFRGTAGVHFGSSPQRTYGAGKQEISKTINLNIINDLSNATIYGIDDLDNHIKKTTEKTFYELNSVDGAIGY